MDVKKTRGLLIESSSLRFQKKFIQKEVGIFHRPAYLRFLFSHHFSFYMHSPSRFDRITFDDFKCLAQDASLSAHEKIGFPKGFREEQTPAILAHLQERLPALAEQARVIMDIGCGCGDVAHALIALCARQQHSLLLLDSAEMLAALPTASHVHTIAGAFPETRAQCASWEGKVDAILVYSVLHHVFLSQNIFAFIDHALSMLAPGGRLLLADLPNLSKRDRFLSSDAGRAFHREFTQSESAPPIHGLSLMPDRMDDAVILSIVQRYRHAGFETYLLPQPSSLSMHQRREDVLIVKW